MIFFGPDTELEEAFAAAAKGDGKPVSVITPRLIREGNAQAAFDLVTRGAHRSEWLPEAFALLNVQSLNPGEKRDMLQSVFSYQRPLAKMDALDWAGATARIGRLGFSFPQWRFLMQGYAGGASLAEQFGMKKLKRATDVRDLTRHFSDPARDNFGAGFVINQGPVSIEFRRAYILCSNRAAGNEATIVIRNSSYFFGRDRLPEPAYISWQGMKDADSQALRERDFAAGGAFSPWQNAFADDALPLSEKLRRATILLDTIDGFDNKLAAWLRGGAGVKHLESFTRASLAKPGPVFYVCENDDRMPPWYPHPAIEASAELLAELEALNAGRPMQSPELRRMFQSPAEPHRKLVLLSGPKGDLPLRPK